MRQEDNTEIERLMEQIILLINLGHFDLHSFMN